MPRSRAGQPGKGFASALWERHKRGYIVIAVLLLGTATLFKSQGPAAVALVYALFLSGLEIIYRVVRYFLDRHKATWWGKPRPEIPKAYAVLAVGIFILLLESRLARSWLVATSIGAVLVAAAIHLHRAHEERERTLTSPD